jgi:hypothetical protein
VVVAVAVAVESKDWIRLIEAELSLGMGCRMECGMAAKEVQEKDQERSNSSSSSEAKGELCDLGSQLPISIVDAGDREEMKVEVITHALLACVLCAVYVCVCVWAYAA